LKEASIQGPSVAVHFVYGKLSLLIGIQMKAIPGLGIDNDILLIIWGSLFK
jgi:hypothetical protein